MNVTKKWIRMAVLLSSFWLHGSRSRANPLKDLSQIDATFKGFAQEPLTNFKRDISVDPLSHEENKRENSSLRGENPNKEAVPLMKEINPGEVWLTRQDSKTDLGNPDSQTDDSTNNKDLMRPLHLNDPEDNDQTNETPGISEILTLDTTGFSNDHKSDRIGYPDMDSYRNSDIFSSLRNEKNSFSNTAADIEESSLEDRALYGTKVEGKTSISDKEFFLLRDAMYDSLAKRERSKSGAVNTYNLIITKTQKKGNKSTFQYLPNKKVENMLDKESSSGESPGNLKRVRNAVHSAIVETVGRNSQFQEALTQITKEPGKDPVVKIINSTMPNLSELESTIRNLLGSSIVFKGNRNDNITIGYIPRSKESVIGSLLNQTIGVKYPGDNAERKTNIINIFIINILSSDLKDSPLQDSANVLDSSKPSLLPDSFADQNDSVTGDRFSDSNSLLRLYYALKKLNASSSFPSYTKGEVSTDDLRIKDVHDFPKLLQNSSTKRVESQNPFGLNLNKNTILDLLPSFVRATTIPPVVPLHNASLYKNLGLRPSVLGLLPNDVFGISKQKIPQLKNSSEVGIIRKDLIEDFNTFIDNFASKKLENREFSWEKDPSKASVLPTNITLNVNGTNIFDEKQLKDLNSFLSTHHIQRQPKPKELLKIYSPKSSSNENFYDLLRHQTTKERNRKKGVKKTIEKENSSLFGFLKTENSESEAHPLSKVALPGGIAVATALFPIWAPYLLGKRKKRDTASLDDTKRNQMPEDIALSLIMEKIHDLQTNLTESLEEDVTTMYPVTDTDLYLDEENVTTETTVTNNDDEILANFLASAMNELDSDMINIDYTTELPQVLPIKIPVENETKLPDMIHISRPIHEHSG